MSHCDCRRKQHPSKHFPQVEVGGVDDSSVMDDAHRQSSKHRPTEGGEGNTTFNLSQPVLLIALPDGPTRLAKHKQPFQ